MNFVTSGADTSDVQHPSDSYFVRLDVAPSTTAPPTGKSRREFAPREPFEPSKGPRRRRKRRGKRPVAMICLLAALGGWFYWASQRPGGVSGTINGWIENVRGDVAKVSADPDFNKAITYYNAEYSATGAYPQMSDEQMSLAGIGFGINGLWCSQTAVVLQGAQGGGAASHLLLSGRDLGAVQGKQQCPADLTDPSPWKR